MIWASGDSYVSEYAERSFLSNFQPSRVYYFNEGTFGDRVRIGDTILNFEDFEWPDCHPLQQNPDDSCTDYQLSDINDLYSEFNILSQ
jgi:hypothetical protein